MNAAECYENDGTLKDSIQEIADHSYEKHDDPIEAASQEFDQIDIHG